MTILFLIFVGHYVADFVVQSRWTAQNKSKRLDALLLHVASYTMALLWFVLLGYLFDDEATVSTIVYWALLNGLLHFCVDGVTSRISSRAHEVGNIKEFWAVIGADQCLHSLCLVYTANAFGLISIG